MKPPRDNAPEFDYIVVGGGTAGCVLANRLSAHPDRRVLLLEVGGDARPWQSDVPLAYPLALDLRTLTDSLYAEPDAATLDRRHRLFRGRGIGGSSAINGMIHVRGTRADFDGWVAAGATGWGYEDVLPWFEHSEGRDTGAPAGPGRLSLRSVASDHPVSQALLAAFRALGVARCPDFNGQSPEGAGFYSATLAGARRASVARTYLDPVRRRSNLELQVNARAEQVVIAEGRARGVRYRAGGSGHFAHARRAVVLAAGAYGSPQLLMLSGIGPAAMLAAHGLTVHVDAPGVGADLQDHVMVPLAWRLKDGTPSLNSSVRGWRRAPAALRLLFGRDGPWSMPAADVGAFLRSRADEAEPDLQFHALPASGPADRDPGSAARDADPFPGLTLAPGLLRPRARGSVTLASADPDSAPRVAPGYLSHADDVMRLVRGVRLALRVVSTPPLVGCVAAPLHELEDDADDASLAGWISALARPLHHPVGTCRMGSDALAVVDPLLRVRGVEGLRVADAAVMPRIPSANTHATVVMIAERAAACILADDA
jgi:choline dehydrogenase